MSPRVPQFILVGVPRAGTTSLYEYLGQHPGVYVSPLKETNFLSYPGDEIARAEYPWLHFPVRTIEEYERMFFARGDRVAVDFSASCFHSTVAIERIQQFTPDPHCLVLLRDPVARAYSGYLNRVNKGNEIRPVDAALAPGERAVEIGFYYDRICAYRAAFGAERVRVWLFDDLSTRPQKTLGEIFEYVGVNPAEPVDTAKVHNRGGVPRSKSVQRLLPSFPRRRRFLQALPKPVRAAVQGMGRVNRAPAPPLPSHIERRLRGLYAEDIRRLEGLIRRDLGHWISG